MNRVKERIFREFDDTGADTLEKHWAQIEYTAYWCTHLLVPNSNITAVIPEGIDDVVLIRGNVYELHQVKCRDESQQPWTTAEVMPILCAQYHRKGAFNGKDVNFHFVSDHFADVKTQLIPGKSFGQLYRLKYLLDIKHDGQTLLTKEEKELTELENAILPKIRQLLNQLGDDVDEIEARTLLYSTWIDTKSPHIRTRPNLEELSSALSTLFPGQPSLDVPKLDAIYTRLLMLIVRKITTGTSLEQRKITRDDVLSCRSADIAINTFLPELDTVPGTTVAEKKAHLGGFDVTEIPIIVRQLKSAQAKKRKLEIVGIGDQLEDLSLALLTKQVQLRRDISNANQGVIKLGPQILDKLSSHISPLIDRYLPNIKDVDEPFCLGLLWIETDICNAWWHNLNRNGKDIIYD